MTVGSRQTIDWTHLSLAAWEVRSQAFILGATRVGASALSDDRRVFVGCNVEHRYRSHDVHAEVNAITTMIASGSRKLLGILVAAERDMFTPCGACMDWIFQFGEEACLVAFQSAPHSEIVVRSAHELMPYYPR
jgi:cytidine deaminase